MSPTTEHVIIAVIAGLPGTLAFLATMLHHFEGRRRANRELFLKEQMALCFRACAAVGQMLSGRDVAKWDAARTEFWTLYLGPLCVVEDQAVESAMEALGRKLPSASATRPDTLPLNSEELELLSLHLAHATRALILKCWGADRLLGALKPPRAPSAT